MTSSLIDFCVAAIAFWLAGFALMFGQSWRGLVGIDHFAPGETLTTGTLAFFVFQTMFCGTATTITSGAVAERIRFRTYLIISILISGFIHPVLGHWAWGGLIEGSPTGWLAKLGFIDFAGSTVVHSVGAWVALAAVLVIGPRRGRFSARRRRIQNSSLPMTVMGVLLFWFGWFGFNGGSTLALTGDVPLILLNASLASAAGGLSALAIACWRIGRPMFRWSARVCSRDWSRSWPVATSWARPQPSESV
jgi:Amt family ammonium transporter